MSTNENRDADAREDRYLDDQEAHAEVVRHVYAETCGDNFCPMHSADPTHAAVRQNRVNLDLPPQPCSHQSPPFVAARECVEQLAEVLSQSPIVCTCGAECHDFCGTCIARHLLAAGYSRTAPDESVIATQLVRHAEEQIADARQMQDGFADEDNGLGLAAQQMREGIWQEVRSLSRRLGGER